MASLVRTFTAHNFGATQRISMTILRHLWRPRQLVCRQWVRKQHVLPRGEKARVEWAAEEAEPATRQAEWEDRAKTIKSGAQQSMLEILEERGLVKDVAG